MLEAEVNLHHAAGEGALGEEVSEAGVGKEVSHRIANRAFPNRRHSSESNHENLRGM